ncbi:MAG: hypothetical protein Q9207_007034 [Kuettlingeria erythrocarpa]
MDPKSMPRSLQPPVTSTQLPLTVSARPSASSASSAITTAITSNGSDGNRPAPKKRRISTATTNLPSSRGVANLTPEQLAKKRANDREAQRAIRERTKTQIETLEKEIRKLRNEQPHQELQTVLKQKQLVETENVHIKKKLSAALSLLQPLLGATGTGSSRYARPIERFLRFESASHYFGTTRPSNPAIRISDVRHRFNTK